MKKFEIQRYAQKISEFFSDIVYILTLSRASFDELIGDKPKNAFYTFIHWLYIDSVYLYLCLALFSGFIKGSKRSDRLQGAYKPYKARRGSDYYLYYRGLYTRLYGVLTRRLNQNQVSYFQKNMEQVSEQDVKFRKIERAWV